MAAATNPARARGPGKPLKHTESDLVSWARRTENFVVRRESSTVTVVHATTEVVMPLDTLRMLADQLYRVLMTQWKENRSTSLWALDQEKGWKPDGVYTNAGIL